MVELTINGELKRFDTPLSIEGLLAALGVEPRKVAVERNLSIVPKSSYGATRIADGDRIEIVQFVGGG